jgi:hypothetical protein
MKSPIQATNEGTNRVLTIGDLTITIDQLGTPQTIETPPGILFDLDNLLVKLIVLSDQINNAAFRDVLLLLRSQLSEKPEIMKLLVNVCASCVIVDDTDLVRIPRTLFDKMKKVVNDVALESHKIDPADPVLYVGDDFE